MVSGVLAEREALSQTQVCIDNLSLIDLWKKGINVELIWLILKQGDLICGESEPENELC